MTLKEIKEKKGLTNKYNGTDIGLAPIKTSTGEELFKTNVSMEGINLDDLAKSIETELNKFKSL